MKKNDSEVPKVIPAGSYTVNGVGPTSLKKRHHPSVSKLNFKLRKHKDEQQKLYVYNSGKDNNLTHHLPVSNKQPISFELSPKSLEVRGPSLSRSVVKQSSSYCRFPKSNEKASRHFSQSMAWQ